MLLNLYSVRDIVSGVYTSPMTFRHDNEARRAFVATMHQPDLPIAKHPQEYDLFIIGTFDDVSGAVTSCPPVQLQSGIDAHGIATRERSSPAAAA